MVQTPQGHEYEGRRHSGKGVSDVSLTSIPVSPRGSSHHSHSASLSPQITGVSILRAGETMEPALRAVCKDVRIGKILIQTNLDSGEPEVQLKLECYSLESRPTTDGLFFSLFPPHDACLRGNYLSCSRNHGNWSPLLWPCQLHYLRLPKDISEDHVILMDSTVSTGAAAMMAVRVLLVGYTLGSGIQQQDELWSHHPSL